MINPGKFGGIPSNGASDIMGTNICHADADTDADNNGIRTETNMSPPPSPATRLNDFSGPVDQNMRTCTQCRVP